MMALVLSSCFPRISPYSIFALEMRATLHSFLYILVQFIINAFILKNFTPESI